MNDEIIVILGKRGFGKTVWLKKYLTSVSRLFVFDPIKDINAEYYDSQQLIRLHAAGFYKSPRSFRHGASDSEDAKVLAALSYVTGNCVLAIDECSIAFDAGPSARLDPWYKEVIFMGRHQQLTLVVTAQRAVSVPISIRSQASRIVSFAQHEGIDIMWLRDYFGNRVSEIPLLLKLECLDSCDGEISKYSITY